MCVVNEISLIVVLIKGHQHLRVRNLLDATYSMIKRVALSASLQTRVISLVCARQSKNNIPCTFLTTSEQNDRCLPLAGTSRIFPSQLLEFFFNSAGATFPPSVRPHPTSSLSLSCLFILAVRARAFKTQSRSFSPCTHVTRHSAAKTVSLRDVAPPRAPNPFSLPPSARLQCSPSALRCASFPSVSQKLLIYLSYERARGKLTRARRKRRAKSERRRGKQGESGWKRREGWEGMRRNN